MAHLRVGNANVQRQVNRLPNKGCLAQEAQKVG